MHGEYKMPGGKLVVVDLDLRNHRLADVQVSGDFFLEPDSALDAINAALCGLSASVDDTALITAITAALDASVSMYGVSPVAIAVGVRRALENRVPA